MASTTSTTSLIIKTFIVLPIIMEIIPIVMTMAIPKAPHGPTAEENLFAPPHLPENEQPILVEDSAAVEKHVLEEESSHPKSHHAEEVPHPHVIHKEDTFMENKDDGSSHKTMESKSDDSVPEPHIIDQETDIKELLNHHDSITDIHHNMVDHHPFDDDDESEGSAFEGTESSMTNEDHFESHPNTGIPEVEPTVGTESGADMEVVQEPVVLPVTEGKNSKETVLPKELMPIYPGGGSRFEDLEREKLEKKKMSQIKDMEEDTDNGASHEAEGLYSSAATLCLSSVIFSLSSSFRLIV